VKYASVRIFLFVFWASLVVTVWTHAQGTIVVNCNQADLLAGIAQANTTGGGTVNFNCQNQTIWMDQVGLGVIQDNVVLDGENRDIELEFNDPDLAVCTGGNNAISGPPIARVVGSNNAIRNLTFRHFTESIQISGPNNTIETNKFLGHPCSDDAVSTTSVEAVDILIKDNHFQDYEDKAFQMSFGGGIVAGNTFLDTSQAIRGPYDNSLGAPFTIADNVVTHSGDVDKCNHIMIDGTYQVILLRNTISCKRGLRLGGSTEAIIRHNNISNNERVGIRLSDNVRALLEDNVVRNNSSNPGSLPGGGVVVMDNAKADLGGGSINVLGRTFRSGGRNTITGDRVKDVRNLRSGYILKAKHNFWNNSTVVDVLAHDVESLGPVDVDPVATRSWDWSQWLWWLR